MSTPIPDDLYTPAKHHSLVWTHFKLSIKDKTHAFCCVDGCSASRRTIKRLHGNTTSLMGHLRAPSERVFSVASLVLTDRRRRLDDSRVARLMFLKRNMALYQELTGKKK
jgi:hypothetical protein